MPDEGSLRRRAVQTLSVALCLFTLAEVNYPQLSPITQLAIFSGLGLVLCFLALPLHVKWRAAAWSKAVDWLLAALTTAVTVYLVIQTEPSYSGLWFDGSSLGDRAGAEVPLDHIVGAIGLLLVLEGARRAVGPALPILSLAFLAYAAWGQAMPDWLFPHRGYDLPRIVGQTFLHSQGVFGVALKVMFTYVFLFVVFGAFLELTGATSFIIAYARRLLGQYGRRAGQGGDPVQRIDGFAVGLGGGQYRHHRHLHHPADAQRRLPPRTAAGIEAAASSGGALVPPVMGAGAYMMLEIVEPPVTYLRDRPRGAPAGDPLLPVALPDRPLPRPAAWLRGCANARRRCRGRDREMPGPDTSPVRSRA